MYENNNRLLVDEAIAFEPIKNTFRLGWEFVKLNQQFTITAMIIFILLNLLVTIQVVSFIFMVLSAIFVILIQK